MWKCQALVYAPGCWRSDKGSVPQVPPRVTWPCRLRDADCVAVTSPVPQFPSQELGIPGSTPLPAPGWQCRLSPALWGCHRGWPWPCPRCRGFVQDWHSSQPVPFGAKGGLGGSGLFQSLHPSAATPRRDWDSVGLSQGVTRAVPLSPSVPISVLLGSSPPGEMPPPR